ncbi:hypothetical protein ILYODFUR_029799, partial [Ilyodon furcidens]
FQTPAAPALDVVQSRCFVKIFYGKPHENGLSALLNHVAYKAPQRVSMAFGSSMTDLLDLVLKSFSTGLNSFSINR